MIVKLLLENIGPFTEPIEIDFRCNKRDRDQISSTYTLPDGEVITKVAGIIAGNAYGKTSILTALTSIGRFLNSPLYSQQIDYDNSHDDEEFKNYVKNIGVQMLAPINKKSNGTAKVSVDMYINNGTDYSGYYTYSIKYDSEVKTKGVLEESLRYRNKFNSKKIKTILEISNNFVSEIGHFIAYKNNYINGLSEKMLENFNNKYSYFETFYNKFINESSIMGANNYIFSEKYIASKLFDNKNLLCGFMKLSDNKIIDLEVDDSDIDYPKLYVVYKEYKLRYGLISSATKKLCSIGVNFCEAYRKGGIFLIDELDNSFNRNISKYIISVYNTGILNNTSQIIFTTNTAEILSDLRRDQIFIIERNDNYNYVTKYLNFVDQKNNKKSRKDWSFVKIYNENIINNFPDSNKIHELNDLLKNNFGV